MATGVAGSLSPWPLGWIAATSSGQIYLLFFFFFAGKVAGEGGGWQSLFARGGQWVAASG
jgi:hypothetical protein